MTTLVALTNQISEIHQQFVSQAVKQVNTALTLRNWVIGWYIVEYEQNGTDRADYGEKLIENLSKNLRQKRLKGYSSIALRTARSFFLTYPQIQQTLSVELQNQIFSTKIDVYLPSSNLSPAPELLLNRLTFSHFIELLRAETPLKRAFYETEAIKNNWSVRHLERAMNSLLFERTGLSTDKQSVLEKYSKGEDLNIDDVIKNPYILEFLGLDEKPSYSENDLEQAIINHLQEFLMEAGRGFCFEARQKRITFDNTHYKIDLVFYHRILKCHVLIDLKIGAFSHADSGQMQVYLNYFQDQEMTEGDNPPIGIILCSDKNETLVKYATTGLSQQVLVSKYLINLPKEEELQAIILEEQQRLKR